MTAACTGTDVMSQEWCIRRLTVVENDQASGMSSSTVVIVHYMLTLNPNLCVNSCKDRSAADSDTSTRDSRALP